ncbi:response regulator [Microlunatus soli]|uniref:DNA-binding response regulator, NarL/FixJ family, contains REC and HTH domains n=1 Tax=Microlunatus soli TaxID=630515 RepID=A0A1H1SL89_9ACTN|nr:response regulator transcription factor [Microlunatus soli]SDS48139.1 DNA-binding response regulator, NarL/FixJ family, contains REC and HTH domains [Microlunatus soli]
MISREPYGPDNPIRIVLADDHQLVRRGIRLILESEPDLKVVGEASDGAEVVALLRDLDCDLVILDVSMPRMTGLQAAREIARRTGGSALKPSEGPRLLMLSMHDNEQYFFSSLQAGASGYVLKSVADEDLVGACRAAIRDETFVYPGAMRALVRDYLGRISRGEQVPDTLLTPREDEVLKLIAEGYPSREIAETLVISIKTVERHRANIMSKLGMRDRTQVTRYAIRAGLIEP